MEFLRSRSLDSGRGNKVVRKDRGLEEREESSDSLFPGWRHIKRNGAGVHEPWHKKLEQHRNSTS
ncbi:hypothetical protein [Paenibacillus tuaregi]|uniref:hypothetical protein n=1 Tax=Paenibacillus tuaregi TaxID=1816681 RepID=UPI0011DDA369|nr:hypothetical protein [Paenibacillus tuaregi]